MLARKALREFAATRLHQPKGLFEVILRNLAWVLGLAYLITLNSTQARDKRPNILVILGDDIGTGNIRHNNRGMMG